MPVATLLKSLCIVARFASCGQGLPGNPEKPKGIWLESNGKLRKVFRKKACATFFLLKLKRFLAIQMLNTRKCLKLQL